MKTYTVVGFFIDNDQRWTAYYQADSYEEAENKALAENEGLAIVASFEGRLDADPFVKVSYNT